MSSQEVWTEERIQALREQENLPFVRADSAGIVQEINHRFREIYGWRDDELIGESLGLILPPSFRDSHHAGFARFQLTEVSKVLNHPLKLATYCSDGRAIDSEHFIVAEKKEDGSWSFAATLRPLYSQLDQAADVSQSVNSSDNALIQQLRQSLGMLQVAFDAATEAMLIVDAERQVHWANQAAAALLLSGVPIQLANRKLDELMALKPEQVDVKAMVELLDRRHPLPSASGEGRCRIAFNDGDQSASLWLRWRPVELIHAQFLLLTFRDLSPDEQALSQQQRFMTDLTHELRTPLAIVNGNLQRLSRFKRSAFSGPISLGDGG
jgi:PAS domain S-box-containing protein